MVQDTADDTVVVPSESQDTSSDVADLQVGEEGTSPEAVPEVPESEDREAA